MSFSNHEGGLTVSLDKGFEVTFLGQDYPIPFPVLEEGTQRTALNEGEFFPFTHFSIVMNKERKFAIYCAHNIDLNKRRKIERHDRWHYDSRIGEENQVGIGCIKVVIRICGIEAIWLLEMMWAGVKRKIKKIKRL